MEYNNISSQGSHKGSAIGEFAFPKSSKLETQIRAKRLTSDEMISSLVKMLEIQLQRLDITVNLSINTEDPLLRIVEAVKLCVDELMDVKEKLKLNSFVSATELDSSIARQDPESKVSERLSAANKQLKHFERLLEKKEKIVIDKEKEITARQKELEKEKEQIEITKTRLQKIEESGLESKISFRDQGESVKSLALRLASEKESLETKKIEIAEQIKVLEHAIDRFEREKLYNNDMVEANKKVLETINKEKGEILETKKFIERQKNEMVEVKANNERLLGMVNKERTSIKVEEEKVLKQKFDLDAKIVYFNREKNEFAKNLAELESERNKLAQEKDQLQKMREKLLEEKDVMKHEYQSLEEIKEQLSVQNQLEFESKERLLMQREEELENSIIDLKIQIENYNMQMEEKEIILKDREDLVKENEKQVKISCANIRLAEMSLIESKSQCEETMQNLLPKIENCYEELELILKEAFEMKIRLENAFAADPGKFVCSKCANGSPGKVSNSPLREIDESSEIQAKIMYLTSKEEEARLLELKNLATADRLQRAVTEFEEKKRKYEEEILNDKERLRKNFSQLDNSLRMIKEKENELNMMKGELSEKEKILRIWEQEFKRNK